MKTSLNIVPMTLLGIAAASLVACGGGVGGTDTSSSSGSTYVSWAGNANDTIVKDASNQSFAVSKSDRSVVYGSSEISLIGTKVDSNGNLSFQGVNVGSVSAVTSTSGSKIAQFKCIDGSALSFSIASSSWTYSCESAKTTASTSNSGTSSSGSSSSGTSGSASSSSSTVYVSQVDNCAVLISTKVSSGAQFYKGSNKCSFEIKLYTDNNFNGRYGSLSIMAPGQTGPGENWWLLSKGASLNYFACPSKGPNGEDVYTNILDCFYRPK